MAVVPPFVSHISATYLADYFCLVITQLKVFEQKVRQNAEGLSCAQSEQKDCAKTMIFWQMYFAVGMFVLYLDINIENQISTWQNYSSIFVQPCRFNVSFCACWVIIKPHTCSVSTSYNRKRGGWTLFFKTGFMINGCTIKSRSTRWPRHMKHVVTYRLLLYRDPK